MLPAPLPGLTCEKIANDRSSREFSLQGSRHWPGKYSVRKHRPTPAIKRFRPCRRLCELAFRESHCQEAQWPSPRTIETPRAAGLREKYLVKVAPSYRSGSSAGPFGKGGWRRPFRRDRQQRLPHPLSSGFSGARTGRGDWATRKSWPGWRKFVNQDLRKQLV